MTQKLKILAVCSENQWRSPTAEAIYRDDDRVEVRSAGTSPNARHTISVKDVEWADLIVCMESKHREMLKRKFSNLKLPPIKVLNIPDKYQYMDPELIDLLKTEIETSIIES